VYVDNTVNYSMTAKRLMWGKCMNMGQTCVAPDFIICSKEVEVNLVRECKKILNEWYGKDWRQTEDLARIVNLKHFNRINNLVQSAVDNGATVAMGGEKDPSDLWIQPTIVG